MAKLRKMLGDINSGTCKALMALIGTQNHATIIKWAVGFASERYLPLYAQLRPDETRLNAAVEGCRDYLSGGMKFAALKPVLSEARKLASGEKGEVAQAAARAVSTACASAQTPTNAFGFLMYGAAAAAYARQGLDKPQAVYDAEAKAELQAAYESLQAASVENEPNPVKIDWNCLARK